MTQDTFNTIYKELQEAQPEKIKITKQLYRTDLEQGKRVHDGTETETRRMFYKDGEVCYYRKGARRYGYRLENHDSFLAIEPHTTKKRKTDAEKWETQINRLIKMLEQSGFWVDVLEDAKTAKAVGYDKIREANAVYRAYGSNDKRTWEEKERARTEAIRAIDSRLVQQRDDLSYYPNTTILWHLSDLKIKKMYFGRWSDTLQRIEEALTAHPTKDYRASGRTSYDVSFQYKPATDEGEKKHGKRAWYSEEFRDCGNGHYYLALSPTHAIYWERD